MSLVVMENLYYIVYDVFDVLDKWGFGWLDVGKKKGKKGKGKKKKK